MLGKRQSMFDETQYHSTQLGELLKKLREDPENVKLCHDIKEQSILIDYCESKKQAKVYRWVRIIFFGTLLFLGLFFGADRLRELFSMGVVIVFVYEVLLLDLVQKKIQAEKSEKLASNDLKLIKESGCVSGSG